MMLLHTITIVASILAAPRTYENMSIVNVQIDNPKQLERLRIAGARSLTCFDHGGSVPLLLDSSTLELVESLHLEYKVVETNVDQMLANFEHQREVARSRGLGGWYSDYKTWEEVNLRLESIASSAPQIASTFLVGTTHEGRNIQGIRITAPGDATNRVRVLFNGCQHAREWVAVMVPMYTADQLVAGWYNDPEIQTLLTQIEVIIVPIVNPDGYAFTYAVGGDRFWRKNRRNNVGSCEGVDLNRNWNIDWNGGDSTSTSTCSDVYVGPAPFSEPETQAMRDLINSLPNFVAHIDFHSYSQLVLEAWGYTSAPPPRVETVKALSASISEAIASVHGETYVTGTPGAVLYFADGTFQDWSTNAGALGYTVELRPVGSPGFDLPPNQIIPTCEENYAGVTAMLRFVNQPVFFSFPNDLPQFLVQGEMQTFPVIIDSVYGDSIDTGTAEIHVRYGSQGGFATRPMVMNLDGSYEAQLPASPCSLNSEYWFSIETIDGQTWRYPEGDVALSAGVATQVYAWNMDTNPNWSLSGLWGWGVPTGGGGEYGNPDPTSGATGTSVLGYNLNGDYENYLPQRHLVSEPLDFTNYSNVSLQFKRHLNVEQPAYDHASISVRVGVGAWTTVWTNSTTIEDNQWQTVTYDISSIADHQSNVTVRWTMGTTDSGWRYSGWNIDDVEFLTTSGSGLAGDVNCDGAVDVTDVLLVVGAWGQCPGVCNEDIIPDGIVNIADLLHVIGNW